MTTKSVSLSAEERELIGQLLAQRWGDFDRLRMDTRPDSAEERYWLELQQGIEILQAKLHSRDSVTPNR